MSGPQTAVRFRVVALAVLLALLPVLGLAARSSVAEPITYPTFANAAFQGVWERYDRPVYYGTASRSYIWGSAVTQGLQEPYAQGPNGQHLVQYFDKSRMEINNPAGNPSDPFYVTQGLLAADMINGRIQIGDTEFQQASPAPIPFGDLDDTQAASPTYASFQTVLNAPPIPSGQSIVATLDRAGNVTNNANPMGVTSAGVLEGVTTNHTIASVFLAFLLSQGTVYVNGQDVTQTIFDPLFYVTGYPITEAYWATVKAAGVNRTILIQCFERRCLTYSPTNEPAFQVELANTGLQYYNWRYAGGGPSPSPSPSPSQAPTISNLTVTNISSAAATVTWTTDVPATSEVNYGTSTSYGQTVADTNLVTAHTVNLAGLAANTLYHYQVASVNTVSGARTVSADQTFTTTNVPGPTIGEVTVTPAATTARFQFTTSPDATVQLTYQIPGNGASELTYSEGGPSGSHDITIAGLTPSTEYSYSIVATTADGGQTTSDDATFTTDAAAPTGPTIGAVTVTPGATGAVLSFSTTPAAAVQVVYHVTGASDDAVVDKDTPNTTHLVGLTGLTPNTSYTYRITATAPDGGQTTGDAATFTTAATSPPGPTVGTPVIFAQFGLANFTVSTAPAATVHVVYSVTGDPDSAVIYTDPAGPATNHQFTISPLQSNTSYTYRIIATTADGGITITNPATFTTPGPR